MKKFITIIILFILLIFIFSSCELKSPMIGYFLITTNGGYMIITSDNNTFYMNNLSDKETLFDDLQTGDKIIITYTSIEDSYPARTGAYSCWKLKSGSIEDIPEDAIKKLKGLGIIE